ncbi:Casein kinase I isoform beta, partial [Orchesella cincta]
MEETPSAGGAKSLNIDGRELVNGRYKFLKQLGYGAFGVVYSASDTHSEDKVVALKQEWSNVKNPQLKNEFEVYTALGTGKPTGIPRAIWYGVHKGLNTMAMELMGPSLGSLVRKHSHKFTMKTMIERLEYIHSRGFLHRDLQPDNFCMGLEPFSKTVYLIDFGLSTSYRDPSSGEHLPHSTLESGECGWGDLHVKKEHELGQLCKDLPTPFEEYLEYCKNLEFAEDPDYPRLRKMFKDLYDELGYAEDSVFDWMPLVEVEKKESALLNIN